MEDDYTTKEINDIEAITASGEKRMELLRYLFISYININDDENNKLLNYLFITSNENGLLDDDSLKFLFLVAYFYNDLTKLKMVTEYINKKFFIKLFNYAIDENIDPGHLNKIFSLIEKLLLVPIKEKNKTLSKKKAKFFKDKYFTKVNMYDSLEDDDDDWEVLKDYKKRPPIRTMRDG